MFLIGRLFLFNSYFKIINKTLTYRGMLLDTIRFTKSSYYTRPDFVKNMISYIYIKAGTYFTVASRAQHELSSFYTVH